jgi:hypothetical protein
MLCGNKHCCDNMILHLPLPMAVNITVGVIINVTKSAVKPAVYQTKV